MNTKYLLILAIFVVLLILTHGHSKAEQQKKRDSTEIFDKKYTKLKLDLWSYLEATAAKGKIIQNRSFICDPANRKDRHKCRLYCLGKGYTDGRCQKYKGQLLWTCIE